MSEKMIGPESEQLDLPEDAERLADIGDLILAGEPIERFDLTKWERIFVEAYVRTLPDEAEPALCPWCGRRMSVCQCEDGGLG